MVTSQIKPLLNKFPMLGLNFCSLDLEEALSEIERLIQSKTKAAMLTPSAELIVLASEDSLLRGIYNSCAIVTIDSYIVFYTAKILGKNVKEPVSASRVMFNFLEIAQRKGYRMYLLGANEDVLKKTVQVINAKYPGAVISGSRNGYFDFNEDYDIINDINSSNSDILFIAMSSPLKEHFIQRNLSKMNVPVAVGVGGAFDIIAGKCSLAPLWVSKLGFEWLYRFIQEPRRMWKRYLFNNTKYIMLVIRELFSGRSNVPK